MEPRSHCDTAGADGIKEAIVTVQNLLETRLHCDTVGNHGIKEPIVTRLHGTNGPWLHGGFKKSTVTPRNIMEP